MIIRNLNPIKNLVKNNKARIFLMGMIEATLDENICNVFSCDIMELLNSSGDNLHFS